MSTLEVATLILPFLERLLQLTLRTPDLDDVGFRELGLDYARNRSIGLVVLATFGALSTPTHETNFLTASIAIELQQHAAKIRLRSGFGLGFRLRVTLHQRWQGMITFPVAALVFACIKALFLSTFRALDLDNVSFRELGHDNARHCHAILNKLTTILALTRCALQRIGLVTGRTVDSQPQLADAPDEIQGFSRLTIVRVVVLGLISEWRFLVFHTAIRTGTAFSQDDVFFANVAVDRVARTSEFLRWIRLTIVRSRNRLRQIIVDLLSHCRGNPYALHAFDTRLAQLIERIDFRCQQFLGCLLTDPFQIGQNKHIRTHSAPPQKVIEHQRTS